MATRWRLVLFALPQSRQQFLLIFDLLEWFYFTLPPQSRHSIFVGNAAEKKAAGAEESVKVRGNELNELKLCISIHLNHVYPPS